MKTRESERGGATPKACSQTRRKLAKSRPSRTTFRPTPVSCGITERSLLCSIKSSLMRDFRVRSPLPAARPAADLSQLCARPVGPVARHSQPRGQEASPAARNTLDSARIPRASKLLICDLFQKGRVLAQDAVVGRAFRRGERLSALAAPVSTAFPGLGSVESVANDVSGTDFAPQRTCEIETSAILHFGSALTMRELCLQNSGSNSSTQTG